MIVLFIPFLFIIFYGIGRREVSFSDNLSINHTLALRGICCLSVIFHHLGQFYFSYSTIPVVGMVNNYLGSVPVGIFFFLSGYGLILQYSKSGNKYLKKLFILKIPILYIQFVLINLLYYFCLEYGSGASFGESLLRICGLNWLSRVSPNSWYIYTILCAYIVFGMIYFLLSKLKALKFAPLVMCVISFAFIITFRSLRIADMYLYARTFECFLFGLIYATYKAKLDPIFNKYSKVIWIGTFCVFVLGLFIKLEATLGVFVCASLICFGYSFSYSNVVSRFLGKISLWVYLIHGLLMSLLNGIFEGTDYATMVFICSIAVGAVFLAAKKLLRTLNRRSIQA